MLHRKSDRSLVKSQGNLDAWFVPFTNPMELNHPLDLPSKQATCEARQALLLAQKKKMFTLFFLKTVSLPRSVLPASKTNATQQKVTPRSAPRFAARGRQAKDPRCPAHDAGGADVDCGDTQTRCHRCCHHPSHQRARVALLGWRGDSTARRTRSPRKDHLSKGSTLNSAFLCQRIS